MKNNSKFVSICFFISSICYFLTAYESFYKKDVTRGSVYVCFAISMLILSIVNIKKTK